MNIPGSAPPVRTALDKFRQAKVDLSNASDKAAASEASRRIYESMAEVCNAYFRQTIPPLSSNEQEGFPAEVALILAGHLTNLVAGKLDESVREMVGRPGARGRAFLEREDIEAAVRYLQAVEAKMIEDRAPVARISAWFGVDRATAQKWRREEKRDLLVEFWPEDSIQSRAKMIENRAVRGGARQTKDGRGQKAIAGRRAK